MEDGKKVRRDRKKKKKGDGKKGIRKKGRIRRREKWKKGSKK